METSSPISMVRNSLGALSHLCHGKLSPNLAVVARALETLLPCGVVQPLLQLLADSPNTKIKNEACLCPDEAAERAIAADIKIALPYGLLKVCYISMLCEKGSQEDMITAEGPERSDDTGCWLSRRLNEIGFSPGQYDVTYLNLAQGDALPDLGEFDSFVLGGTLIATASWKRGDKGRPWQRPLREWLLRQRQTGKPLLGICGAHQAMTVVLGGEVTRRPGGVAAGSLPVKLTLAGLHHSLFEGVSAERGDAPAFNFFNQEEVSQLPEDAVVLATTEDSPAVAIDYGGGWLSVQFHPEASHSSFQHWVDEGIIRPPSPELAYCPLASGRILLANFLAKSVQVLQSMESNVQ